MTSTIPAERDNMFVLRDMVKSMLHAL